MGLMGGRPQTKVLGELNIRQFPLVLRNRLKSIAAREGLSLREFALQVLDKATREDPLAALKTGNATSEVGKYVRAGRGPSEVELAGTTAPTIHSPRTCQIFRCRRCRAIGWSDPERGV